MAECLALLSPCLGIGLHWAFAISLLGLTCELGHILASWNPAVKGVTAKAGSQPRYLLYHP